MLLKINTPIEIYDIEANKTYKSILVEITDQQVLIAYPMDKRKLVFFQPGSSIEVSYTAEGSRYAFNADILGSRRDLLSLYILKKPLKNEIRKVQRRQYFRIEANLKVDCEQGELITFDISGGGLRCSYPSFLSLEAGNRIIGHLHLPKGDTNGIDAIPFEGKVIRILPSDKTEENTFAVQFTNIEEKNREKIIQFCFRMQRRGK